nr:hypothetical protein [Tanacetum cinerariifolium]
MEVMWCGGGDVVVLVSVMETMVRRWCRSGRGDDVDGGCDDVVMLARQVAAAVVVLRLRGDGSVAGMVVLCSVGMIVVE